MVGALTLRYTENKVKRKQNLSSCYYSKVVNSDITPVLS